MNNVAFLVIAHKNPQQVKRLLARLKNNNATVFLHIDKNALGDWDPCKEFAILTKHQYHGILGSKSLIKITDELIETAKKYEKDNNTHFSYYCLLSGQDYPLIPVSKIVTTLQMNYPQPYLDCTPWSYGNWIDYGSRDCSWYYRFCRSLPTIIQKNSFFRKIIKFPFFIMNTLTKKYCNARIMLMNKGFKLYGGSAWWVLPDIIISDIIQQEELTKHIEKRLMGMAVPEETYYQTLIMHSIYKDIVQVNVPTAVEQNCKTFANFRTSANEFIGHPYILRKEDFRLLSDLSNKHYFFARKFDCTIDKQILDMIDLRLLGKIPN